MDRIITLADHAGTASNFKSPVDAKIADLLTGNLYRDTTFPFKDMHVDTSAALALQFPIMTGTDLPTVQWTKINKDPTPSKTSFQLKTYTMAHLRAPIEIDNAIVNNPDAMWDAWEVESAGHMAAISYATSDAFFAGDPLADDNTPIGLPYMAKNASAFQLDARTHGKVGDSGSFFYCGSSGGIDISSAGGAAGGNAAVEAFLKAGRFLGSPNLDDCVIFGSGNAAIQLGRRVAQLGAGGGYSMTSDAYDRTVEKLRGAKIRDAGFKRDATTKDDTSEQISLTQTVDASAETGGTYTSFLIVNMNKNKFRGWQPRSLMLENRPVTDFGQKKVIDWGVGFAPLTRRSFVYLSGFKVA
jgi:hypothetical protein